MNDLAVELAGEPCLLTPEGGLVWQSTLFVADLHFGKSADFRSRGIGVPGGTDDGTLARLCGLVARMAPSRVVLLGDTWHSARSAAPERLAAWQAARPGVTLTVVLGNHDRSVRGLSGFDLVDEGGSVGPFVVRHRPVAENGLWSVCGHVHPVVRLPSAVGQLRCFWLDDRQLVLPAFGEFTGGYRVDDLPGRKFVSTGSCVIKLP